MRPLPSDHSHKIRKFGLTDVSALRPVLRYSLSSTRMMPPYVVCAVTVTHVNHYGIS